MQRIHYLYSHGLKASTIAKVLQKEKLRCSRFGIDKFIEVYETTGSITRQPGSGRPSKVTAEIKEWVEAQLTLDDVTTAYQLQRLLTEKGYSVSLRTVSRCQTSLGRTFCIYLRLLSADHGCNRTKRLAWARQHVDETFEDVIWSADCTVQMESHKRFARQKHGNAPRPKPRFVTHIS